MSRVIKVLFLELRLNFQWSLNHCRYKLVLVYKLVLRLTQTQMSRVIKVLFLELRLNFQWSLNHCRYKLVLVYKCLDTIEYKKKNHKDGKILDPSPFYQLPKTGCVSY